MFGDVAVVTGASAGLGRAIARELGRRGMKVALLARGREGLEAAKRDVEQAGGEGLVVPTDVADAAQVERAAVEAERRLGAIDVWINNAMVTVMGEVWDVTPEEFDRVTRVNYLGAVHGTLAALQRMRPRNRGHIIQVGSALAYRAIPLQSAYCATKFAMRGFTDSLRAELMHHRSKVRLTMVQLPALNTPQFGWSRVKLSNKPQPVPPIFQPEVGARAVVGVLGKRRREVYVGGSAVKVIVGNKVAPGLGDRYLARKGYSGQLTDLPLEPDHRDNLFEPVPGDHGAHGRFWDARNRSVQSWLSVHRAAVLSAVGAAVLAAALLVLVVL